MKQSTSDKWRNGKASYDEEDEQKKNTKLKE